MESITSEDYSDISLDESVTYFTEEENNDQSLVTHIETPLCSHYSENGKGDLDKVRRRLFDHSDDESEGDDDQEDNWCIEQRD